MTTDHEQFMQIFIAAETKMRAYALSCGVSIDRVDDLIQEAAMTLWRRFKDYDPKRSFLPWALGVMHKLIQQAQRRHVRTERVLAPSVSERLAETLNAFQEVLDRKRRALRDCIEQLPAHQKDLLNLRYHEGLTLGDIALRLRKGLSAVNMTLHRIRQILLQCVEREMPA